MSQSSYSVFHTTNGSVWKPVLGVSTAGAGLAPGGAASAPRGPGSSPGALAVVSDETAYMSGGCEACGNGTVQVYRTGNGGHSWSHGAVIFGGGMSVGYWSMSFPTANDGWLVTQSALLHSTDGGRTWREDFPASSLTPVNASLVTSTIGYGVGVVGDAKAVVKTTNGGDSWHSIGSLPGQPTGLEDWNAGASVAFSTVSVGFATLYDRLYRTTDAGRHWEPVTLPGKNGLFLDAVKFLSPRVGLL